MIYPLLKRLVPKPIKDHLKNLLFDLMSKSEKVKDNAAYAEQLYSILRLQNSVVVIPPKHLQIRVSSAYYGLFFLQGKDMLKDMEKMLNRHHSGIHKFNRILDFGCGCGRFLIPLSMMVEHRKLYGTDIDAEAIEWFKPNYPTFGGLDVNGINAPSKYDSAFFDFIYSISIFTHLPEDMHLSWIEELSRIMQPGGYGVFTIHGSSYHHVLTKKQFNELKDRGFYYLKTGDTEGLPEFYQTAFHTDEYIREKWGKYFEIVEIVPRGLDAGQDAVIVRKR